MHSPSGGLHRILHIERLVGVQTQHGEFVHFPIAYMTELYIMYYTNRILPAAHMQINMKHDTHHPNILFFLMRRAF